MTLDRLWNMIRISLMKNGFHRAEYLKKKQVFAEMGENCFFQPRNIPPEAKLIKMHNNVVIASEVLFINHDVIHHMLKNVDPDHAFSLHLGAIEIGSNVFIGSRCMILPGTLIEDNVIIGAGSVVKGRISEGVWVGVPVERVGEFKHIVNKRQTEFKDSRRKAERYGHTWDIFFRKWVRNAKIDDSGSFGGTIAYDTKSEENGV